VRLALVVLMVHVAAHWQLLRTVDSESHKQSGWAGGRGWAGEGGAPLRRALPAEVAGVELA